LGSRPLWH